MMICFEYNGKNFLEHKLFAFENSIVTKLNLFRQQLTSEFQLMNPGFQDLTKRKTIILRNYILNSLVNSFNSTCKKAGGDTDWFWSLSNILSHFNQFLHSSHVNFTTLENCRLQKISRLMLFLQRKYLDPHNHILTGVLGSKREVFLRNDKAIYVLYTTFFS